MAAALLPLLAGCRGSNSPENNIKPISASLTLTPFPGSPDPAIYLEKVSTTGDLVTVNVKLHTTGPVSFSSMNLEFTYDYTRIQIAGDGNVGFEVNPALLGDCRVTANCTPFCLNNAADANQGIPHFPDGLGHFVLGVTAQPNCPPANVTTDNTTLLTLAFIAATTIDPPGSRISLVDGSGTGDCELLSNASGSVVDLGIPCVDGGALMTASR